MKSVRVVLSPDAEAVYNDLNRKSDATKIERSIFNSIKKKIELIRINPHYDNPVSKDLIPNEYKINYGVTNLFHVELSNFWRMLYTLTNDDTEVEIIAFVLDITNHKDYDKKFGYKSK